MPLKLNGSTSGYVIIDAPAVAGTNTLTLPAVTGTVVTTASSAALPVSAINATGTPSASTFLRGDGAWAGVSASGQLIRAPQFKTSGTSHTTPAGCTAILVEMLGGGGGGGTAQNATTYGGGGGSGAYGSVYITVSPSTAYTISIGAGGASATAGGNTSITVGATTYTAGGGGAGGSVTSGSGAGGAAGAATNLQFSFNGNVGGNGASNYGAYPNYVNFVFGAAAAASGAGTNGISATLYGCSGSGGRGDNSLVRSGGSGTQGWMRIWEFT